MGLFCRKVSLHAAGIVGTTVLLLLAANKVTTNIERLPPRQLQQIANVSRFQSSRSINRADATNNNFVRPRQASTLESVSGTVPCDFNPPLKIRSAYLDHRYRHFIADELRETCVVGIAEIPKSLNRSEVTECVVTMSHNNEPAAMFTHITHLKGRVKIENMKVEEWIGNNLPLLNYQQAFVYCIVVIPESWNVSATSTSIQWQLKLQFFYLYSQLADKNGRRSCLSNASTTIAESVIPMHPPDRASGIEICVAVFRPQRATFDVSGMLSTWIQHYRMLGTKKIHLYVDNADNIENMTFSQQAKFSEVDRQSLSESIRTGLIDVVHWPPEDLDFTPVWHSSSSGKKLLVGDGKVFYWSQATAYNDCMYKAASRGVRTALLDFDDFLTGTPYFHHELFDFPQHALSFAWIQHFIECPIPTNGLQLWDNYAKNMNEWKRGPLLDLFYGSIKGMNGKAIYDPWYVIDSGVHAPQTCIDEVSISSATSQNDEKTEYRYVWCRVRRLNNTRTGYYISHLRTGNLTQDQCRHNVP